MLSTAALAAICLNLILASGAALARTGTKPTIVFVHGAFADASGFGAVTSRLQHRGYTVISPANPLRGPASDAAYVASVLKQIFAADVPARTVAQMASAQRPVSLAAIQEKSTEPAWKTIPSWYLIGRQDEVINPAAQRFMAKRANAHTTEINSSHASYISHPAKVTELILRAVRNSG